ncbi:hypothetical protein ACWG8W_06035 [Citricoccus zhacaiensis]
MSTETYGVSEAMMHMRSLLDEFIVREPGEFFVSRSLDSIRTVAEAVASRTSLDYEHVVFVLATNQTDADVHGEVSRLISDEGVSDEVLQAIVNHYSATFLDDELDVVVEVLAIAILDSLGLEDGLLDVKEDLVNAEGPDVARCSGFLKPVLANPDTHAGVLECVRLWWTHTQVAPLHSSILGAARQKIRPEELNDS